MEVTMPDSGRFQFKPKKKYYLCVPYVAGIVEARNKDEYYLRTLLKKLTPSSELQTIDKVIEIQSGNCDNGRMLYLV